MTAMDGKTRPTTGQFFDNFRLLTIDQVAEILGKKPQTIRNMIARREIPFIPGRPNKVLWGSLADWLKKKEIEPCQ